MYIWLSSDLFESQIKLKDRNAKSENQMIHMVILIETQNMSLRNYFVY